MTLTKIKEVKGNIFIVFFLHGWLYAIKNFTLEAIFQMFFCGRSSRSSVDPSSF